MKVLIIGGFLGSGKTTVLAPLARYLAADSSSEDKIRVAVLENEIGTEGIDDALLQGGGFTVSPLYSGCVCCTMAGELLEAAERIQDEISPDWLIVETTGLAYPKPVVENLQEHLGLSSRVCVLADAARWKRIRIPLHNLLLGQISQADVILVNKCDLVSPGDIQAIDTDLLEMNDRAERFFISARQSLTTEVMERILGEPT